jgi:prepilin-type N-terminal cleavage/methylation domain-containing protein
MSERTKTSSAREGFTLVEVMVSMTLLSVASLALIPLLFRVTRAAEATAGASYQTATLAAEASRFDALPFDSLTAGTSCVTVTTGPVAHTKCTTVSNVSPRVKQVMIVVTPSGNGLLHPDTTIFNRTKSTNANPLKTP